MQVMTMRDPGLWGGCRSLKRLRTADLKIEIKSLAIFDNQDVHIKSIKLSCLNLSQYHLFLQKEQSGGTISRKYIGMFEAVMHCSAEYPQNVSLLHDILNPYLDQTLNLTFVKSLKGRLKKHQSEYVVSVSRVSIKIILF